MHKCRSSETLKCWYRYYCEVRKSYNGVRTSQFATMDTAKMQVSKDYLHVSGNTAYFGVNPGSPSVGDMRISLTYAPPGGDLSVIAQVQGNTFTKYTAGNGKEFSSVRNGIVSAEQMFEGEHKSN